MLDYIPKIEPQRPRRPTSAGDVLAAIYTVIAVVVGVTWPIWMLLIVLK